MKKELIQTKINEIIEIVLDFDDPYRTESFKILLKNELDKPLEKTTVNKPANKKKSHKNTANEEDEDIHNPEEVLKNLAEACTVSIEQIKDIIDYENNHFVLLKKINGSSIAQKQINATLCLLTAWIKGAGISWIKVTDLAKELKEIPISTKHLGDNLTRTEFFVPKGTKLAAKYHITTKGWKEGITLIKSLVGEENSS